MFLLTLPFGFYLRYYFECKWYKALIFGFLLSLFFELTQLTGLYGIYPRPYRLFDVDDLILNTVGTMIGYLITPLIAIILPTRKELDEKSFEKGKKVTFFRRALSYLIDFFFLVVMFIVMSILLHITSLTRYIPIITLLLYYLVIPIITNGKTLGKMILRLQVVAEENSKFQRVKIGVRYLLSYILFYYQFILINLLERIKTNNDILEIISASIIIILKVYFWLNILSILYNLAKKQKKFLYERLTKTKIISTIEYEREETTISEEENKKEEREKKNVRVKKDKKKL